MSEQRATLLPLAAKVASLPEHVLQQYTHPHHKFAYGWSRGQERLQSGQPDTLKGSFYANPLHAMMPSDAAGGPLAHDFSHA